MTQNDIIDAILFLFGASILSYWYFVQVRHWIRRFRSRRWPLVNAIVQAGAMGNWRRAQIACMGYAFTLDGVRRSGIFALCGDEPSARRMLDTLPGAPIKVRYNPENPDISLLAETYDPRFGMLSATQNPEYLQRCPQFDLQATTRTAAPQSRN